ncbi:hypothetical protein E2320_007008 [Naja naja]|nr:hypothetical protein E2320_007008 [Naja naja]
MRQRGQLTEGSGATDREQRGELVREKNREQEKREEANLLWIIEPVKECSRNEGNRREMSLLGTIQAVLFAGGSSIPSVTDSKREPRGCRAKSRREEREPAAAARVSM